MSRDVWDWLYEREPPDASPSFGGVAFTPKNLVQFEATVPKSGLFSSDAAYEMWPGVMVRGYSPMFDPKPREILRGFRIRVLGNE